MQELADVPENVKIQTFYPMDEHIFACLSKKQYNYRSMKRSLVILLFLLIQIAGYSQTHKFQSVFIYSFTRYIQWPDAYNQGDFEILVLGDTPILDELKNMAQTKKVNGDRTIKVTKINNVNDIKKCNILYVPSNKSSQIDNILTKVNALSILIVTEEPGLGVKGSNINFIVKDGKLAFELNQAAITKKNLRISNELSRLAIMI
ncbi:YfiR family protein [Ohtaekwangia kribbensis]|uniref:YfiR family protein n=1 Tax=Ohtaekwangia kribbensis TaxID=688913 RepID=A0ABW3JVZ0_9BACT